MVKTKCCLNMRSQNNAVKPNNVIWKWQSLLKISICTKHTKSSQEDTKFGNFSPTPLQCLSHSLLTLCFASYMQLYCKPGSRTYPKKRLIRKAPLSIKYPLRLLLLLYVGFRIVILAPQWPFTVAHPSQRGNFQDLVLYVMWKWKSLFEISICAGT